MCDSCPNFDKDTEMCNREIKNLKDEHCFKKNNLWLLAMVLDELRMLNDSWDEGDSWKRGGE